MGPAFVQQNVDHGEHPFQEAAPRLDTEIDPDAGGFLDCFELTSDQLPVVISPDHRVLRNPSAAALADHLGLAEAVDPHHL